MGSGFARFYRLAFKSTGLFRGIWLPHWPINHRSSLRESCGHWTAECPDEGDEWGKLRQWMRVVLPGFRGDSWRGSRLRVLSARRLPASLYMDNRHYHGQSILKWMRILASERCREFSSVRTPHVSVSTNFHRQRALGNYLFHQQRSLTTLSGEFDSKADLNQWIMLSKPWDHLKRLRFNAIEMRIGFKWHSWKEVTGEKVNDWQIRKSRNRCLISNISQEISFRI
jgi:hypothetical protein